MDVLTQVSAIALTHNARKHCRCVALLPVFLLSLVVFVSNIASAQTQNLPADVRVVIDVSGSMKQNDPNDLRKPALELLVKLLPEGSKAGVWTFGRYINMLVPHREVNDEWRRLANSKVDDINSTGLYTNIGEALEKASYDLERGNDGYRTSLILLTDGMVDISREPEENEAEWRRIVDEILPRFKNSNFTIHTIALSENADDQLMHKIALSTDGVSSVAQSADELMKIFLAAFDTAAPAEKVPLENNTFVVDSSVEEFTALIFRNPGSPATRLISPDDEEYSFDKESSYVSWYRSDNYDLITVSRPIEGEWRVVADLDPDSRVTIVSNLNLVVKPIKNNFAVNELGGLSLLLREDGKTITRSDFLKLLDISYRITRREDGETWQDFLWDSSNTLARVPVNGIYETPLTMFDRDGTYHIEVLVDGKSFKREFSHTVSVREPFGVQVQKDTQGAGTHHLITVSSFSEVDLQNTKVSARIKDPQGRSSIKPLALTEVDNWQLHLETTLEGVYDVVLRVDAVDSQGKSFEFSPPPVQIKHADGDDPFTVEDTQAAIESNLPAPQISDALEQPPVSIETEVEPEPEIEPEIEPVAAAPEGAESAGQNTEDSKLLLYIGLGVGNVLILVMAFFVYRMIMGKKDEADLDELEKIVEEAKSATQAEEKVAASSAPPSMADMSGDKFDLDNSANSKSDEDSKKGELADSLLADDLDIASDADDEVKKHSTDAPPPLDSGESPEEEDLGMTDVEFSLDDFSSDDLEDEDYKDS